MLTNVGSAAAGIIAIATVLMGARYLIDPQPAAAGFGIPGEADEVGPGRAWLAVKAARDIAIGIAIAGMLVDGAHQQLGYLMAATSLIPIADGTIVIRAGGPKAIAYGIHWSTAAVMLAVAALLIV